MRWALTFVLLAACAPPVPAELAYLRRPLEVAPAAHAPRPVLAGGTCADDQNVAAPSEGWFQGAQWIAFRYEPSRDLDVELIELFTDHPAIAILADDDGRPGEVLRSPEVAHETREDGWAPVLFDPPISVAAGRVYWIAARQSRCSISTEGTAQTYYGSFHDLAGPWEGPWLFDDHRYMARIRGRCAP